MAKRGPKPKKIDPELIEKEEKQPEMVENEAETVEDEPIEEENDVLNDPRLPDKSLFRVDEAASYFRVTDGCIRLWIQHGHLKEEKIVGSVRISRESILKCRFNRGATDEES